MASGPPGIAVRLCSVILACIWTQCAASSGSVAVIRGIRRPMSVHDDHAAVALARERALGGISPACAKGMQEFSRCQLVNGVFYTCSDRQLLLNEYVEKSFGCDGGTMSDDERMKLCREKCLEKFQQVLNTSMVGACNASIQAMWSFSAPLNLFEVGDIDKEKNFTDPVILPMPNVKGLGGIQVIELGKPDKCAQIPGAQYCLLTGAVKASAVGVSYSMGYCLPDSCNSQEIQGIVNSIGGNVTQAMNLHVQCGFVEPLGEAMGTSKAAQDILGWGGVPVKYPFMQPVTTGFVITILFVIIFFLLVIAGTAVDWRRESQERELAASIEANSFVPGTGLETAQPLNVERPQLPPMKAWEAWLNHWSALRNGRSFLRTRQGANNPFACMDAIRTISMAQVILGHMYVYSLSSSGMVNMEQFNPPYGMMGMAWFMIVPGCFYGVDSFFLLSGFLCCYSLQKKVFSKPANRSLKGFAILYPKFIFLRVVRLLPLEMFCIALCVNVLPLVGTGILWNMERPDGNHCFDAAGGGGCEKYWWTNMLFIQDFDQYFGKCFGHTWYLANDMQLYLTAPLFSLAYSYSRKIGWACIAAGLCVGVLSPMIIAANLNIVPDTLLGGNDYMAKIYVKPYCRCTPFFVGIAAAWLWQEKLEEFNFRHVTMKGRITSYSFSLLGLAICAACIFGRVVFYQCDLATCMSLDTNPGGRFALFIWAGFSILGWSVGLSIIMILCFQNRFLPLVQNFLHLSLWQPFAKLSYACYLCHTSVLIMNYCQQTAPVNYSNPIFFFYYVAFVAITMFSALCLNMLLEKPLANIQMKLFAMSGGD